MADRPTDERLRDIADPWHALDYDLGELRVLAAGLARELLATRTAAKARRIETDAELHAVPERTVVRARDGSIAARANETRGVAFGDDRSFPWSALHAPATILFDPNAEERDRD